MMDDLTVQMFHSIPSSDKTIIDRKLRSNAANGSQTGEPLANDEYRRSVLQKIKQKFVLQIVFGITGYHGKVFSSCGYAVSQLSLKFYSGDVNSVSMIVLWLNIPSDAEAMKKRELCNDKHSSNYYKLQSIFILSSAATVIL